jgi:hypothetical protein
MLAMQGPCDDGEPHTLGPIVFDDRDAAGERKKTRHCGKCKKKLWLIADVQSGG